MRVSAAPLVRMFTDYLNYDKMFQAMLGYYLEYGEMNLRDNDILLIVPAYNEAENIVSVVNKLQKDYPELDYVVINDGSTDDTAKLCKDNNFNMVDLPVNCGLAGAFQTGMRYALYNGYRYAIQYDGDGQHNPEYILGMYEMAEREELDIVIGSRFVTEKKPFTARMLGSRLISACIKITTGKSIKDPTSGMRMFNRRMIKKLALSMNYGPEPDTVGYLLRCGAKVKEYQVEMNERVAGESYLNFSRSVKYMMHMILSIVLVQWFRGKEI